MVSVLNLKRLLQCFHVAFGLKVNLHKSKIYGVVENGDIVCMANFLKYKHASFPFIYLSVPIGAKMKLTKNLESVVKNSNVS